MAKKSPKVRSKKRNATALKIIKAIEESNGFLTTAARRAGVSYMTVWRYARDYPSVALARDSGEGRASPQGLSINELEHITGYSYAQL